MLRDVLHLFTVLVSTALALSASVQPRAGIVQADQAVMVGREGDSGSGSDDATRAKGDPVDFMQPASYDSQQGSTAVPSDSSSPRVIVVTAAGRHKSMQLLLKHLQHHVSCGSVDEWHLWDNTRDPADLSWMRSINKPWVHVVDFPHKTCDATHKGTNLGITCFWRHEAVQQKLFTNMVVRLDDDIVWMDTPRSLTNWLTFTRTHPQYFITFATVLNNAMSTYFLQERCNRFGNLQQVKRRATGLGWKSSDYAVQLHRTVLATPEGPAHYRCDNKTLPIGESLHGEHVSINAVAWHGADLAKLRPGVMPHNLCSNTSCFGNEELDLTVNIPREKRLKMAMYGGFVVAHYSFFTQAAGVDNATDILQKYSELAEQIGSSPC